jgi:hypothetical protein
VIAFFLTDPQGRRMYYRIDRVTGEFFFNYVHPMNGKCTRATQQF